MTTRDGNRIIEFYGDLVRIGIEGKWVEFLPIPKAMRPKRQELRDMIDQIDYERETRGLHSLQDVMAAIDRDEAATRH